MTAELSVKDGGTYPSRSQLFPSFGLKVVGVFAVEVFAALHGVERPLHDAAFGDEEWGFAI